MNYSRHITMLLICLSLCLNGFMPRSISANTKEIKIHGYITNVLSPTSFEIDDYRINRDASVVLELENQGADVKFSPDDIRVGTEVEIRGDYDEETKNLRAKRIKIDLEQFRKFKMTAILNRRPEGIEQTEQGWRGMFFPDGHRVRVEPFTQVLFKLNKSEQKAAQVKQKAQPKVAPPTTEDSTDADEKGDLQPLRTLADVGPGMLMTYEGTEQADGTIAATRVVFMRNEMSKEEAHLWKSLKIREKPPKFVEGEPGELKIDKVGKFKLLPSQEVQTYVASLGQNLIPSYQRSLPDGDPQKIPFRFYVVRDKQANAFALPNGVVVVNSGMFDVVENEGQLAAVMSHEIAHATQEHTLRQQEKDKKKRTAIAIGGLAAAAFGLY